MNVRGRDMGGLVEDLRARIDQEVDLPPGYFVEFGGQFENQQRAMARLAIVVPITLGLIFLLLYSAFGQCPLRRADLPERALRRHRRDRLAVRRRTVPVGTGGGRRFIAVFGVAVLNGVVLASYVNELREQGLGVAEAVALGARTQARDRS
ncbi:MAG: efflux RND transporter permease subunit [Gammaproteobacteria bacterium]|nr:efflux RND transporter permease subunit [Gammaproteobacteria bacterium]